MDNRTKSEKAASAVTWIIVGWSAGFLIGGGVMYHKAYHTVQRQAVELGYAEWTVDLDGDTEFQWLDPELVQGQIDD